MVNSAERPRKRIKKRVRAKTNESSINPTPKKKRIKKRIKKVAEPKQHDIIEDEIDDINSPIELDLGSNIPNLEDLSNFGDDKRTGFNVENMLKEAQNTMGHIFDNLTNDNKTFGSKMDSILSLQMLALLPTIQNLDDTMFDERKAQAAVKLNETINHLKSSLVQKQQFEIKEEVDLQHPKIQKALTFLTEAFFYVLTEVGVDPSVKSLIINSLSLKMMGFEEELNKRFKGVAFSLLEQVENPLLESLPNVKQLEALQEHKNKQLEEAQNKGDDYEEEGNNVIDIIPERS